jgi:hypothetical protein
MKSRNVHTAAALACLIAAGGMALAGDIRKVKAIDFRGLKLMSKYEVVRNARMKALDDGIAIDLDSLDRALAANRFIKSYRVEESGGRLTVSVAEKIPDLIMAVSRNNGTVLYELDAEHSVISKNEVHADRIPVLCLAAEDVAAGPADIRVRGLLSLLDRVRKISPAVYREISEIYFDGKGIRVTLRGRKTGFVMMPLERDFIKLRYIAGYCDRAGRYPEEINLTGDAVVVR